MIGFKMKFTSYLEYVFHNHVVIVNMYFVFHQVFLLTRMKKIGLRFVRKNSSTSVICFESLVVVSLEATSN